VLALTRADTGRWFSETKVMAIACKKTEQRQPRGVLEPGKKARRDQVGTKLGLSPEQNLVMKNLRSNQSITELMAVTGRTNRTKFRDQVLKPLIDEGLVEMTIPHKPQSSKQEYRLTSKGRKMAKRTKEKSS
jgi:predicted transcriptional regulator